MQALKILKKRLHPKGHLVLAVDNRFGIKYWAGAMEPHTGRYFDSLEGNGSTCSRKELEVLLEKSGLGEYSDVLSVSGALVSDEYVFRSLAPGCRRA